MADAVKRVRLPRWQDFAVFVATGLTVLAVMATTGDRAPALWFVKVWGGLSAVLAVVTALRQRSRPASTDQDV